MTGAEEAKKRRDKARSEGKCLVCYKRPQMPGRSRCEECHEKYVAKRSPEDAEARKQRREQAVAQGRCYTCCVRPVKPDCRYCDQCVSGGARKVRVANDVDWCDECLAFGFHRHDCITLSVEARRVA